MQLRRMSEADARRSVRERPTKAPARANKCLALLCACALIFAGERERGTRATMCCCEGMCLCGRVVSETVADQSPIKSFVTGRERECIVDLI